MNGFLSIASAVTVLIPLPLLALQIAGAAVLARRLPPGPRRTLGVAAFGVGALASLVSLGTGVTARLAPQIQHDLRLPTRQIALVLDLLNWVDGLIGAAALLLVVLALLRTSVRSENPTW